MTDEAPAVGAPVATLLNVHVLAPVSHAVVVVVRTNCDVPAYATVAVVPVPPVQATVGVEVRKKFDGKLMVILFVPTVPSAVASAKTTVTTAVPDAAAALGARCAVVIVQDRRLTWPPKTPDEAAELARSSVDWTVTDEAPAVGAPVATLLNVHVLAPVSHAVVVVVRTNCDVPAYATVAVVPVPPVQATVGVEVRKKFDGKLMVILFVPTVPSAVASAKTTATTAVPDAAAALGTRCAVVIVQDVRVICPPCAGEFTQTGWFGFEDATTHSPLVTAAVGSLAPIQNHWMVVPARIVVDELAIVILAPDAVEVHVNVPA